MTREEAIVELELAARFCVNISALSMAQNIANAIAALREPDSKGCWYCEDGVMMVSDSPNKPPVNANYCGLCGKKLEVTE